MAYASGMTKTGLDGVPVLDSVACVLKAAESMVDLQKMGIFASRRDGVYHYLDKEVRQRVIDRYKDGHRIIEP